MPEPEALHEHTLARTLHLPSKAADLCRELRAILIRAHNQGRLLTPPHEVHALVERIDPPPNVDADLRERKLRAGAHCIVGGDKNQGRTRDFRHLRRNDGAWFDFSITVREQTGPLELLAYDFEIRLPPEMGTPFLRFDYNLPEHQNESRNLRCHVHPGYDDVLLPAPLMSPQETLSLFVEGLRTSNTHAGRSVTDFEVGWLRKRLEQVSPRPAYSPEWDVREG